MIQKIIKLLSNIFTIIFIVIVIYLGYCRLSPGGSPFQLFNVLTGSMGDTINPNSLVVTKSISAEELNIGDIVTYERYDEIVTHRIIDKSNEGGETSFVTKGDRNNNADALPVKGEQIQGKVVFSVPMLGRFGEIIQTRQGQLAIVLSMCQLLLLLDFISQLKELFFAKKDIVV